MKKKLFNYGKKKISETFLGGYIKDPIELVTKTQVDLTPPYPDSGIEYAGFFKRKIGGKYDLVTQKPFNDQYTQAVGVVATNLNLNFNGEWDGKIFFLTDLHIEYYSTLSNYRVRIYDLTAGVEIGGFIALQNQTNPTSFHFSVPIAIKTGGIKVLLDANSNAADILSLSVNGFLEDSQ